MISVRVDDGLKNQLEEAAEARGETRSALMQRYIEEGLRMDRHPGVIFRSGPAGRRPALAGGPDVWEVVRVVQNVEGRGEHAIGEAAGWLGLSRAMVRLAVDYYADHPEEIEAWMRRVDAEAERAEAIFERRRAVLR